MQVEVVRSSVSLPPELQDGYLIHSAVLASRLNVLLLPRQVLLATKQGQEAGVISFVHGVPQASTMAGVTHARDKRLRRHLLNIAKLPVVPGITFSSHGERSVRQFISRVGYPLVLTTAIGENPSRKTDEIWNKKDFFNAVSKLRVLTEDQFLPARSLEVSAYGENILSFSEDDSGRRIASPQMRLLVEKSVRGHYIRCLVCNGEILAAIELDRSTSNGNAHILGQVPPDLDLIASRAASVVPGLFAATVDLVVEDLTRALENQKYYIVEVSERSRLDTYMAASEGLGGELAHALLLRQARQSGFDLDDPVDSVAIRAVLEGVREPHQSLPKLAAFCNAAQLVGFMRVAEPLEGLVEGHVQGAPQEIALLLEALASGIFFDEKISAVDEWQVPAERYVGFRIEQ
jgi:hypothetical protein